MKEVNGVLKSLEQEIFRDVFNFYKKYKNTCKWDEIVKESGTITNLHKNILCDKLMYAIFESLEEEYKLKGVKP